MPWVLHQDYSHHVEAEPDTSLAPWYQYDRKVVIDPLLPVRWLPGDKVPALAEQVASEFAGDPPPIRPKPMPGPLPDPEPEPEESREN